jgi:hypothetical protein
MMLTPGGGTGGGPGRPALPDQRKSHALASLAKYLGAQEGLQVIDFGGLNQQNLDFVTSFGHRLYAEDLLSSYEWYFSGAERAAGAAEAHRIEEFLKATLAFEDSSVGAVFLWDRLQFVFPQLAEAFVARLKRIMAHDALLLAIFHPEQALNAAPRACLIVGDSAEIIATPKGAARLAERFNARAIERLFSGFGSVKFYMTRDSQQEVLIRR